MHPRLSGSGVGVTSHAGRQQHGIALAVEVTAAAAAAGLGSVPFGGRPSKRPLHFFDQVNPSFIP
jgi:hypothetical protein